VALKFIICRGLLYLEYLIIAKKTQRKMFELLNPERHHPDAKVKIFVFLIIYLEALQTDSLSLPANCLNLDSFDFLMDYDFY
jgi:hypothetical protein